MDQPNMKENIRTLDGGELSSSYIPPLELTEGQPPPIAANGGLSYMSFEKNGDAGTSAAIEAALAQIEDGKQVVNMIENAPPGPIKTKWGLGFRDYDECLDHINTNGIGSSEGTLALPLAYTIFEQPTYSIVPSNSLWKDPLRSTEAELLRDNEDGNRRRNLYFPHPIVLNAWIDSVCHWHI